MSVATPKKSKPTRQPWTPDMTMGLPESAMPPAASLARIDAV